MELLTPQEIDNIKKCGKILSTALNEVISSVKPGINGQTLDKIAEKSIRRMGSKPSFLNYPGDKHPFPATICFSLNDEVVHGIPTKEKIIREGDIVSIDIGAEYNGVCTDMAKTVIAGRVKNPTHAKLLSITEESLYKAINILSNKTRIGDIGYTIENYVNKNGMSVVKVLVGHGIGKKPHQEPQIPNYGKKGTGLLLQSGMAIAIEPMVNLGREEVITGDDDWTVKTLDHSMSAHFEHTILITDKKPIIITI